MMKISVFLPCRSGSKRIRDKNVKLFANNPNGLVGIKLDQLLRIKYLDKLYLSTNDEKIIQYANTLNNQKIVIDKREEYLCSDETSTDELIDYVGSLIKSEHVLWTHVTSPLFGTKEYEFVIEKYFEVIKSGYDSLMTVTPIREFLWTKNGAKNYNRELEKWPRTQTLEEIYSVNSTVFINSIHNYKNYNDRIGKIPYLQETDKINGFDIDWPEDFIIAEILYKSKNI